jgi:putative ABC transport system substrate-binding protein
MEVAPKRLEILRELLPGATDVAFLVNPTNPLFPENTRDLQAAARTLGLTLHVLNASNEREIETVFASRK